MDLKKMLGYICLVMVIVVLTIEHGLDREIVLMCVAAATVIVGIIVWFIRMMNIRNACKENNFTLIKDDVFKWEYVRALSAEIEIFKDDAASRAVIDDMDMVSLNFNDKRAYAAQVVYQIGKSSDVTLLVFILESKTPIPYVKIAKKANFFTPLKFLYLPIRECGEIDINKTYKLFCSSENVQSFLDIAGNIMPLLEKNKLNIEAGGNYIVVYKLGNIMTSFDKFVNQTLPIAETFYAKNM